MVRRGSSDFAERRRNKITTAAAFAVTGVGGETNKGRKPLPFWSPLEMIREHAANPKPLHNFSALPRLRWGHQIPMRSMEADDHSMSTSSSSSISVERLRSVQGSFNMMSFATSTVTVEEEDGEGIEVVREKLMLDLKTETDKIRKELWKEEDRVEATRAAAVPKEGDFGRGLTDVTATAQSKKDGGAEIRPWNLRTRRAAFRAQAANSGSPAKREGGVAGKEKLWPAKEKEREKFALGLKKKEIEADFMMLTGHRPPRRPKKRPRAVREQLDMLFPGSWLTEVTAGAYKVVERPDDGKYSGLRRRMES